MPTYIFTVQTLTSVFTNQETPDIFSAPASLGEIRSREQILISLANEKDF